MTQEMVISPIFHALWGARTPVRPFQWREDVIDPLSHYFSLTAQRCDMEVDSYYHQLVGSPFNGHL